MSDTYVYRPLFGIWRCDENGKPIELVDPVAELNLLSRLCEASVNQAHLTDRTHVQHAFLLNDLDREKVDALEERPKPREEDGYPYFTVGISEWNKMVRTLKALAERFLLP